ncbi:MAG: polynucleotide adenylyltransferase PcnB [Deltaproteobacteria bacterium]|nr:polynucleotide adenylyltransferase PcnB [Deltaproteobacteria bacterium]
MEEPGPVAAPERGAVARPALLVDEARIDPDALKVVRRLVRHGFESYLVGGGVRDLLLGRRPKDFDIATKARPEQVRTLFRNSRIIGRRFRLVHVLFSERKVIEVATFRRNPHGADDALPGDDLLIRSDNAFGNAQEDAARRDLRINALFYDVDRRQVIDFVGGIPDIEGRVVRTIGDPEVRFREDPVRMIRAIKFAARLDLGIAPDVYDAIVLCRDSIASAARPRLFEELLKVLRSGAARRSVWLAWETGLLHLLLPELATLLDDDLSERGPATRAWRALGEVDRRTVLLGAPLNDVVLMATLLLEPLREGVNGSRDRVGSAYEVLQPVIDRLALPRRIADEICRIVAILPRVAAGKPGRLARSELYAFASEVVSIDSAAARQA